ncbi:unnamed protein product [Pedinophyceae sp. YPF-701]|nr:unnamed protein product [Pedinophyceae sp. YPF-701]
MTETKEARDFLALWKKANAGEKFHELGEAFQALGQTRPAVTEEILSALMKQKPKWAWVCRKCSCMSHGRQTACKGCKAEKKEARVQKDGPVLPARGPAEPVALPTPPVPPPRSQTRVTSVDEPRQKATPLRRSVESPPSGSEPWPSEDPQVRMAIHTCRALDPEQQGVLIEELFHALDRRDQGRLMNRLWLNRPVTASKATPMKRVSKHPIAKKMGRRSS